MTDLITITGIVATVPNHSITGTGLSITNFRLASTQRRFDRTTSQWVDADTNWFTVTSFRQLATNCATSVSKGQRVLVTGRLKVREWETGERKGTTVEVEADAIGHDLGWGTSSFTRVVTSKGAATDGDQSGARQADIEQNGATEGDPSGAEAEWHRPMSTVGAAADVPF